MTEDEWLRGPDISRMLEQIRSDTTARKLRLFAYAACRRVWRHLTDARSQAFVTGLEYDTDRVPSAINDQTLVTAFRAAWGAAHHAAAAVLAEDDPTLAAHYAAESVLFAGEGVVVLPVTSPLNAEAGAAHDASQAARRRLSRPPDIERDGVDGGELMVQSQLLLDILGNPFRPVKVHPSWLTSTVIALAKGMYESREFSAMPILADALQDAGCDNDEILNHCRDEKPLGGMGAIPPCNPHVRGCWVVDLLLGKS